MALYNSVRPKVLFRLHSEICLTAGLYVSGMVSICLIINPFKTNTSKNYVEEVSGTVRKMFPQFGKISLFFKIP